MNNINNQPQQQMQQQPIQQVPVQQNSFDPFSMAPAVQSNNNPFNMTAASPVQMQQVNQPVMNSNPFGNPFAGSMMMKAQQPQTNNLAQPQVQQTVDPFADLQKK